MTSRIFFNIHAQRVLNVQDLLKVTRDIQPHWALVMDGLTLCKQIKAQAPNCNVIHRAYPDENWSVVNAKEWVIRKKAEIGDANVWCYTFNEVGYSDAYIQLTIDIIKESAKAGLKVVVINVSVGTPQAIDWRKPKSLELLRLLHQHRDIAVLGLHEYACAVITSGFYGGYPDNAGVPPGTPGGQNLIPPANWPDNPYPCYHLGRFKFMVDACVEAGITPPRVVLTEHGFDDVSDIKAWTETLHMTSPYRDIRGWKSCENQWRDWWGKSQGWTHQQAYFNQLIYADETLYQNSPVEAQLIFCWGHTSEMWDQFDIAYAGQLHQLLAAYETPPDTGNGGDGGEIPVVKIDLLPYFNGNGVRIKYELGHSTGGTELLQTQLEGGQGIFRHVKQGGAAQYSKWERLCANNTYIYRDLDTSGDVEVYRLTDGTKAWSAWCPRFMEVGERFTRKPTVHWLYKANGQPVPGKPPAVDESDIVLEAILPSYKMPVSNIVINDVIQLAWYPKGASQWEERYWYAKNYGLVAWASRQWNSYVSVTPSPHPAPVPEQLGTWANPPPVPADVPIPPEPPVTYPFPPANDPGWKVKKVKASGSTANVRAQPNTTSAVVGTITVEKEYNINEAKAVQQPDGKWYPMSGRNGEFSAGWARNDVIVIGAEVPPDPPDPPDPTEPDIDWREEYDYTETELKMIGAAEYYASDPTYPDPGAAYKLLITKLVATLDDLHPPDTE